MAPGDKVILNTSRFETESPSDKNRYIVGDQAVIVSESVPVGAAILGISDSLTDFPEIKALTLSELTEGAYADLSELPEGFKFYKLRLVGGPQDGKLIYDVPYTHVSKVNSDDVYEVVRKKLIEDQRKKTFKDSVEVIGGSKKEMAALRKIMNFGLKELNQAETEFSEVAMHKLITKDKVYPKVDIAKEKDEGNSSGAVYMKVKMRDAYPSAPLIQNTFGRKIFVGLAEYLSKEFADVPSVASFDKKFESIFDKDEPLEKLLCSFAYGDKPQDTWVRFRQAIDPHSYRNPTIREDMTFDDVWENAMSFAGLKTRGNPLYTALLMRDLGQIKEGYSWVGPTYLLEYVLSKKFRNFLYYKWSHSGKGIIAAHKYYVEAKEFEGISTEKSEELKQKYLAAENMDDTIRDLQALLVILKGYKRIIEVDEAMEPTYCAINFPAAPLWQFQMTYEDNKTGKIIRGQAVYYNLKRLEDKEHYIQLFIQYGDNFLLGLAAKKEKYRDLFAPRPDNWAWADDVLNPDAIKENSSGSEREVSTKTKMHQNVPLAFIKRVGGCKIDRARLQDVEGIRSYLKNTFGFRAFEYGKSLPDVEAKEIIYHFLGAISDLGDILNFDIFQLNRKAGLAMSFGARGSGSASAHYEALAKVINLTRRSGDGSVAHEYSHFLDNIIPAIDHRASFLAFASTRTESKRYKLGNLQSYRVQDLFQQLMKYIHTGHRKVVNGTSVDWAAPGMDEVGYVEYEMNYEVGAPLVGHHSKIFEIDKNATDFEIVNKVRRRVWAYGSYGYFEDWTPNTLRWFDIHAAKNGLVTQENPRRIIKIPSKKSRYYLASSKAGGDYWVRDTELMARAFEVFIFDKLKAAGRYNNFICNGYYEKDPSQFIEDWPYPQGQDRKYLFELFDKLMVAVKEEYELGNFQPFTDERVIEEITDVAEKEDIEIDEVPIRVSTDEMADAEKKLETLYHLLTGSAGAVMAQGGKVTFVHDENSPDNLLKELLSILYAKSSFDGNGKINPELLPVLSDLMTRYYNAGGIEHYKKLGNKIFQQVITQPVSEIRSSILSKLAENALAAYDNIDSKSKPARELGKESLKTIQNQIDRVNAWSDEHITKLWFNHKSVQDERNHLSWDLGMLFPLMVYFEDVEEYMEEYEKHAVQHGMPQIKMNNHFHADWYDLFEKVEEITIPLKKRDTCKIEIKKNPAGRYLYGINFNLNTTGVSSGVGIYNEQYQTINECATAALTYAKQWFMQNCDEADRDYYMHKFNHALIEYEPKPGTAEYERRNKRNPEEFEKSFAQIINNGDKEFVFVELEEKGDKTGTVKAEYIAKKEKGKWNIYVPNESENQFERSLRGVTYQKDPIATFKTDEELKAFVRSKALKDKCATGQIEVDNSIVVKGEYVESATKVILAFDNALAIKEYVESITGNKSMVSASMPDFKLSFSIPEWHYDKDGLKLWFYYDKDSDCPYTFVTIDQKTKLAEIIKSPYRINSEKFTADNGEKKTRIRIENKQTGLIGGFVYPSILYKNLTEAEALEIFKKKELDEASAEQESNESVKLEDGGSCSCNHHQNNG